MRLLGRVATGSSSGRLYIEGPVDGFKPGMTVQFGPYIDGTSMRAGSGRIHGVDHGNRCLSLADASGYAWNTAVPALLDGDYVFVEEPAAKPTYNHSRADGPFMPCPECLRRMPRKDLIALAEDLMEQLR
jgi:hypothetical protein